MLRRILLHLSALLVAAALGLAGGAWWTWRQILAERKAPPRAGQVLSGMVMNVGADGFLDLHQWNGKRVQVGLAGIRSWGPTGLVWLIDHASLKNVDVRVIATREGGRVEGEVTFLGVNLGAEMLRAGMARLEGDPIGGPGDQAYIGAQAQARAAQRGCWAPGAGSAPGSPRK